MSDPLVGKAMDDAKAIFDEHLGNLPELLAKALRVGINTGPSAGLVAAWCSENPRAAAMIVGAVAMVAARQLNAERGKR